MKPVTKLIQRRGYTIRDGAIQWQSIVGLMWLIIGLLLCSSFTAPVLAVPVAITTGKQATGLLLIENLMAPNRGRKAIGSAFCIDAEGFFLTNEHLVANLPPNANLLLALNPGETNQKVVQVRVLRMDKDVNLALLKTVGPGPCVLLPLARYFSEAVETTTISAFGFQFWKDLAIKSDAYPHVIDTTGLVTARTRADKQVRQFQVDVPLYPGYSGGPVISSGGSVLGIVSAVTPNAALNFVIPISQAQKLLLKPEIIFQPAPILNGQQSQEREFMVRVVFFSKSALIKLAAYKTAKPLNVTISLSSAQNPPRNFTARHTANGSYVFQAIPVPPGTGPLTKQLEYHVVVMQGNTLLNEKTGIIMITGPRTSSSRSPALNWVAPGPSNGSVVPTPPVLTLPAPPSLTSPVLTLLGAAPAINPPAAQDSVTVKLPAAVEDVVLGAEGRYLILWLKRLHKLAIFDVKSAQVVKFLSIEADDIVFAAGKRKLIVVLNDQQIIQRWDLVTFERELTLPVQQGMRLQSMATALDLNGPVLVAGADTRVFFLDPATLQKMDMEIPQMPWVGGHAFSRVEVRASRDGSVFTVWVPGSSIHGTYTITPGTNKKAETRFHRQWTEYAVPSPDGSLIYTDRGIITPEMQSISPERFNSMASLPLVDSSSYFISVGRGGDFGAIRVTTPLALYSANDRRLLLQLPEIPEIASPARPSWNDSNSPSEPLDKQIFFFATAQRLLTFSKTKDEIVLRHLDILEGMEKADIDYLFITSSPINGATKGQPYVYQLDVKSRRGKVQYSLESGAPGMTLSKTGKLQWTIPADYSGKEENIIISIRDASGQQIYHTFKIAVSPLTPRVASTAPNGAPRLPIRVNMIFP